MDADNGDPFGDGKSLLSDRFHRNEAIAAVRDADQYLGEDDYEDYEDLYNDVNVGEGFLQSVPQPQEASFPVKKEETEVNKAGAAPPRPPLPPQPPHPIDPPSGAPVNIPAEVKTERNDADRSAAPAGFSNAQGYGEAPAVLNKGGVRPGLRPPATKPVETPPQFGNPSFGGEGFARQGVAGGGFAGTATNAGVGGPSNYAVNVNGGASGDGGTTLYVGDLLWWTTDADLESELCKYGQAKEVKFFDEKASGKSKGYCQVDFYDPMAATACKGGMDGHIFNGKPCVVAFATPFSVRRMGEAQLGKNQGSNPNQTTPAHGRGRGGLGIPTGANYGGKSGGNWGRGGGGAGGRGNIRNRMGPSGGRGIIGNGGMNPPPPPVMHPGAMLSQSFDPTGYGAAMGRMGGFGGFPAGPTAPFPGMMPAFPPMVAPHVNPAFFGRGMAPGGVGMWQDPNAGMWGGEEQSNFGEDAASDQQYCEGSHGKDRLSERDWSGAPDRKPRDDREKDMGTGQDWSERRHHDDRGMGREKERERDRDRERDRERERDRDRDRGDRYRDDRDRYGDHSRQREREIDRDDRGRSSGARSKPREFDSSKRRRITPE